MIRNRQDAGMVGHGLGEIGTVCRSLGEAISRRDNKMRLVVGRNMVVWRDMRLHWMRR